MSYLLFDAGGTKTRVAVATSDGKMSDPIIFPSDPDFEKEVAQLKDGARRLGAHKIQAVYGGLPGPLNNTRTFLENAPHMKSWVGVPVAQILSSELNCPVYLENDTAQVALGEAVFGAGEGYSIVAYMTVSTGVGGARVVNKNISKASVGFEPGHHIIDYKTKDTLESLISGHALEERLHVHPSKILDEKLWEKEARLLAVGVHNMIMFWSPDVVVLGGSMIIKTPGISVDLTSLYVRDMLTIYNTPPPIVRAKLGDVGGLYGALARMRKGNPV